MATSHPIEYKDLLDNYEYKVAKKSLMREYPWVKDVFVDEEKLNDYNLIFLELVFNPYELGRLNDWRVAGYVTRRLKEYGEYWSPYISTYYDNATHEDSNVITDEMNDTLRAIHKSPALPQDLKLPGDRKCNIGAFHTYLSTVTPEDMIPVPQEQIKLSTLPVGNLHDNMTGGEDI